MRALGIRLCAPSPQVIWIYQRVARAAIDHMVVRCCVSYFDLISCFESCWQLALSEHDIWLTKGNGKGQEKKKAGLAKVIVRLRRG